MQPAVNERLISELFSKGRVSQDFIDLWKDSKYGFNPAEVILLHRKKMMQMYAVAFTGAVVTLMGLYLALFASATVSTSVLPWSMGLLICGVVSVMGSLCFGPSQKITEQAREVFKFVSNVSEWSGRPLPQIVAMKLPHLKGTATSILRRLAVEVDQAMKSPPPDPTTEQSKVSQYYQDILNKRESFKTRFELFHSLGLTIPSKEGLGYEPYFPKKAA